MRFQLILLASMLLVLGCEDQNSFNASIKGSTSFYPSHVYQAPPISVYLDSIAPKHPQYNLLDSNQLRQGWWLEDQSGPYYTARYYINDTVDGITIKYRYNQIIKEQYKMGVLDGYCTELRPQDIHRITYKAPGSTNPLKYTWYNENGKRTWFTFPNIIVVGGEQPRYRNMKGWMLNTELDSVYAKVPYPNGQVFQEGWIKRSPGKRSTEVGEHIFYDSLGKELMRVNYDTIRW